MPLTLGAMQGGWREDSSVPLRTPNGPPVSSAPCVDELNWLPITWWTVANVALQVTLGFQAGKLPGAIVVPLTECAANRPAETAKAAKSRVAVTGNVLVRLRWV